MTKEKTTEIKKDALQIAIDNIEKKYGKGSVITKDTKINIKRIPTGSLGLDIITGGGYPLGRFVEYKSPESAGKTTCTIHAMIEAQKMFPDKKVAFIDAEHAMDREYARALGLNMDNVIISQPDSGEQGLNILEDLISSGQISLAVVDSVAALTPQSEIDGEMGDSKMGLHARLMSQACRKLTGIANKTETPILWTNQLRDKIGVMFGSPETTTGGNALKFYASIRIDLRKKEGTNKDDNDNTLNSVVTAKTIKNKTFPPFRKTTFDIVFGKGIDRASEILFYAEDLGFVQKTGSWFSYEGVKLGQGAESAKNLLRDNPELAEELESKIRKHYGI